MRSAAHQNVRGHLSRRTHLSAIVFVLSLLFSTTLYAQAPEMFCAREWPITDPNAKILLERAAAKVLDSSNTKIGRWPGRTIPFAVDERVKAVNGLHEAVINAARMVNKYSDIQLVECPLDVAESTDELKGYIYVSTSQAWCDGKCCAKAIGYKPKVYWEGFLTYFRGGKGDERGSIIGIGAKACAPGKSEGGITHEFLHALGFMHAHQSPPSRSYINLKKGRESQCDVKTNYHWMQQYDPASIMHYGLGTPNCTFELKKKGGANSGESIDDLNSSGAICGYNNVPEVGCFSKKTVFGNVDCLSFNDQAWIFAMYKNEPEFGFQKLEGLIKDKTCKAIK